MHRSNFAEARPIQGYRLGLALLFFAALGGPAEAVEPGDANGDGSINGLDVTALNNQLLGLAAAPGAPDCNEDGRVDIADLVCLLAKMVPADPGMVAPDLPADVPSSFLKQIEFLFTGPDPIQTGVAPGTIRLEAAAVLRGHVLDEAGAPLPGAAVTIMGHPEFGATRSRADGMFDIAVNGGMRLCVDFSKIGYLEVQRAQDVPVGQFTWCPDVALIRRDTQVSAIDLSGGAEQLAQGSAMSDADGARTVMLAFDPGTTATMVMPDGSSHPLTNLSVRATEFTVGDMGDEKMPGDLPALSAYTYCVDFTVDEAEAAGAKLVRFGKPVTTYLENFIGLPVGLTIPLGFYNQESAKWEGAPEDARVIKIMAIAAGLAEIDTDGDDVADNDPALGITIAERQRLAGLYSVGQTLWRMKIAHFSDWDSNLPYGTGAGNGPPNPRGPNSGGPLPNPLKKGDPIEPENQVMTRDVEIVGSPFRLHYQSDRVPGRKTANTVKIPVSGDSLSPDLLRIDIEISVAGQMIKDSLPPDPNQEYVFEWDGKDAYGRSLLGEQDVKIRIGNVYEGVYFKPGEPRGNFGLPAGTKIEVDRARKQITLWVTEKATVGSALDQRGIGLGGWHLSVHHVYDPGGRTLYLGDGGRRTGASIGSVVTTFAGGGNVSPGFGDGGPATEAFMAGPQSCVTGPDGSLYISDYFLNRIRRVAPDGIITTVAGGGADYGDAVPATQVLIETPWGLSVGPDGSLYFAERLANKIRRVGPDGIITTVAGSGDRGFDGDGGPAVAAALDWPFGAVVASDGSLLISDAGNSRIRRVDPNGVIMTIAGGGSPPDGYGENVPAIEASLNQQEEIKTWPDGSIYVADTAHARIRRIGVDGIITTVAGINAAGYSGDGGPATLARLKSPSGMEPDGVGGFFISDYENHVIRQVHSDGTISTFAGMQGSLSQQSTGDGGPPLLANLFRPARIHRAADGRIFISELDNGRIRAISSPLPGFTASDVVIPSEDGLEYYVIHDGRHVRTAHALTNATLYQFAYDAAGRLTSVTNGDGLATTIGHDANGNPSSITAPGGQQTLLGVDANGYLASVANPAGETERFSYSADGLMTGRLDPLNQAFSSTYDSLGRLMHDAYADGGFTDLARAEEATSSTVTLTTAMGRVTLYGLENPSGMPRKRVFIAPDGSTHTVTNNPDGSVEIEPAEGGGATVALGPDPRWKMAAPIMASHGVGVPSGATHVFEASRSVTLANPNDPLSLQSQGDEFTVNGKTATRVYDAATRRTTTTSAEGRVTLTDIDPTGRVVRWQYGGLNPVLTLYDSRGRIQQISQGNRVVEFAYDLQDRLAAVTDAAGGSTSFSYDAASRVNGITLPDSSTVAQGYDAAGNRNSLTPPGHGPTVFTSNPAGLLASVAPSVGGSISYGYNADGQLATVSKPGPALETLSYDAAGRLIGIAASGRTTTISYNALGGVATIGSSDGVTLTYAYDGQRLDQVDWSGPIVGHVARQYDADFRLSMIDLGAPWSAAYGYDGDGLATQVGAMTVVREPATGFPSQTTLGVVLGGYTYDAFGDPAGFVSTSGGNNALSIQVVRDALGRVTQKTESVQGTTRVHEYMYDGASRLASVTIDDAPSEAYAYDAAGNRTSGTAPLLSAGGTYDAEDRLMTYGSIVYGYDANGELTTRTLAGQTTGFTRDSRGYLRAATLPNGSKIDYILDGKSRRVGKKVDGALLQRFLYIDQLHPVAELNAAGQIVSLFIYTDWGNAPALMRKGGTDYRILCDFQGSPRLVVDASSGAVVQRMDYDSFGNVLADTNPGFQPFGFAGGIYDRDTRLTLFGAREYDAETGRWASRDPIGYGGGLNLYQYALANPVNRIDVEGLSARGAPLWGGGNGWAPDYFSVNLGISWGAGGSITVTVSRHGVISIAPGITAGTGGVSVGATAGWITPPNSGPTKGLPIFDRETEANVLTGASTNINAAYGLGGGATYSPSSGQTSVELGVGTPGLGIGMNYGFEANSPPKGAATSPTTVGSQGLAPAK